MIGTMARKPKTEAKPDRPMTAHDQRNAEWSAFVTLCHAVKAASTKATQIGNLMEDVSWHIRGNDLETREAFEKIMDG